MKLGQQNNNNAGIRSLVVYKKEQPMLVRVKKSGPSIQYPKVVMPEQPLRYIKAKKHECW
jgi:hypothetical protein